MSPAIETALMMDGLLAGCIVLTILTPKDKPLAVKLVVMLTLGVVIIAGIMVCRMGGVK